MNDPDYIAGLKSNMHATFDTPQGKEVLRFLEVSCGWYRSIYTPGQDSETALISDGRRQVIATIKTFLECEPDQIATLAKQQGETHG